MPGQGSGHCSWCTPTTAVAGRGKWDTAVSGAVSRSLLDLLSRNGDAPQFPQAHSGHTSPLSADLTPHAAAIAVIAGFLVAGR